MKAVALLSGGLDSMVSILLARRQASVELALTIDYGQKSKTNEIAAAQAFCRQYDIKHRVIQLPFMLEMESGIIENSGIEDNVPWVPNRNGLFINLAACFAENLKASLVVCGFNQDEGVDFPDNTADFVSALNLSLSYSTLNQVKVVSMVQTMNKIQIAETAKSLGINFGMVWSCYRSGAKPCGVCPSCLRNQAAYKKVGIDYDQYFIVSGTD